MVTFQKKDLEVLVDNSLKASQQFGMISSKDKVILDCVIGVDYLQRRS